MAMLPSTRRKALGAFYTHPEVVRLVAGWGMRVPHHVVLDPSCGDGRFLDEAVRLGASEVIGIDVDSGALAAARDLLSTANSRLVERDFFEVRPEDLPAVDLVLGNPPFIRYQRFSGAVRSRALNSALEMGVKLSQLTSSWAPFLLHAARFVRPGGDLGMVVPAEISQTGYGLATLRGLGRHFGAITLVAFEQNLFDDAQEETYLLLASDRGGVCEHIEFVPVTDLQEAGTMLLGESNESRLFNLAATDGKTRFAEAFLLPEERQAWERLKADSRVKPVSDLAAVTNGYVSGDNAFFHRTRDAALASGLPEAWLRPALRSAKHLPGLVFAPADLERAESEGIPLHLVIPEEGLFAGSPEALDRFLKEGEALGVPKRFKCRTRTPWWRVPCPSVPDIFVTYMAGERPRAILNRAGAVCSNTLHGVRVTNGTTPEVFVVAFHTSAALLSLEIEGRSYGGGILKIEPGELLRVRLPVPSRAVTESVVSAMDGLLRAHDYEAACVMADRVVLVEGLGMQPAEVATLREARTRLMRRRMARASKSNGPAD